VATTNVGGGQITGNVLYSYVISDQGGYAPNGNLLSATDTVTGTWNYTYDNLNRVLTGTGTAGYYAGAQTSWGYDAFGNRKNETLGGTAKASMPTSSTASYTAATNHVSAGSQNSGAAFTYDAAGDVTYDGLNSYLYDAEGRLCAVKSYVGSLTGYIYDAAGTRVAKGSLTSFSCNFASNGFLATASYVLGPGGEQVTEYSVSGGTSAWKHTNAFAGGKLLGTYEGTDTYFALTDWLGTKRAEAGAGGCLSTFASLPFGDGLTPSGNCPDATEHHFTGKERDTESGNDYFGARYYASSMGRFMSPDWAAKAEPVPYAKLDNPQSLNLYAYVLNNPLRAVDADGHEMNSANPCNGNKNCTSSNTLTDVKTTYDKKDGSTTVTEVRNIVATTNNADGTSTRTSGTVSTSMTLSSEGKETSASQSQSATLVENFNKPNGQGGSTIGLTSATQEHSINANTAFATFGQGSVALGRNEAEFQRGEQIDQNMFDIYSRGRDATMGPSNIQDAAEILKAIAEQFKESQEPK
jgi:RHS repeat-associated protein